MRRNERPISSTSVLPHCWTGVFLMNSSDMLRHLGVYRHAQVRPLLIGVTCPILSAVVTVWWEGYLLRPEWTFFAALYALTITFYMFLSVSLRLWKRARPMWAVSFMAGSIGMSLTHLVFGVLAMKYIAAIPPVGGLPLVPFVGVGAGVIAFLSSLILLKSHLMPQLNLARRCATCGYELVQASCPECGPRPRS